MNSKSISILGGGWLGRPLAELLVKAGYAVNVSTTSESRLVELGACGASACLVDLAHLEDADPLFFESEILIVNIPSKDIPGFKKMIGLVEVSRIKKVLFVSSTSVYQDAHKALMESDVDYLKPCPLLDIERLFQGGNNFATTLLRFSGLMGYSRHPGRFFKSGRPVGNGLAPVNMIHRDDCIGIILAILQQEAWGEVFNACADTHPSRGEFYTRMAMLAGEPIPEVINAEPPMVKLISNEKVKNRLGYCFHYPDLLEIYS